jgi:hypothetical protein
MSDEFVSFLMGQDSVINWARFQQDGARPPTSIDMLRFLHNIFKERVLQNRYPELFVKEYSWPPISAELNFFAIIFCGALKG